MGEDLFSSVLYHEMMHFIDLNINGDIIDCVVAYMSDGTLRKYGDLNYAERGWVTDYVRTYFTEGGCEMFTAEYFTVSPNAYLMRVRFMVLEDLSPQAVSSIPDTRNVATTHLSSLCPNM